MVVGIFVVLRSFRQKRRVELKIRSSLLRYFSSPSFPEIWISFNPEQPAKIPSPIDSIDDGIAILVSDLQPEKADSPIDVTDDGIVICVSDLHSEKADFPIDVTDDGIVIWVSDLHQEKAEFPIRVMFVGIFVVHRSCRQ